MIYRKWWCSIAICNKWLQGSTGFSQCTLHFYQTSCWSSMHRVLIHPKTTCKRSTRLVFQLGSASQPRQKNVSSRGGFKQQKTGWKWLEDSTNGSMVSLKIGVPQTIGSPKFVRGAPQEFTDLDGHYQIGFVMMPQTWLPTPPPTAKVVWKSEWQQPVNIWNNPSEPQEPPEPPGSTALRLAIPLVVASPNKPRFDLVLSGSMIVGDTLSLTKWH